jgi:hypothetical protein
LLRQFGSFQGRRTEKEVGGTVKNLKGVGGRKKEGSSARVGRRCHIQAKHSGRDEIGFAQSVHLCVCSCTSRGLGVSDLWPSFTNSFLSSTPFMHIGPAIPFQ